MKKIVFIAVFLLLSIGSSFSKSFIVKKKDKLRFIPFEIFMASEGIEVSKKLIADMGLLLVTVPDNKLGFVPPKVALMNSGEFEYVQDDHPITFRMVPDDERFNIQWPINGKNEYGIGASRAWSYGTGGKDAAGNEIIVAVVEDGIDIKHEDLEENIWFNDGEIPDNGIDDDGNGYIDDYYGWDQDKKVAGRKAHGTHVSGIIGAKGDNGKHIAGVNWDVKIMPVLLKRFSSSSVLAAYGYILKQKKIWLESEGQKGANVVAVNSSFGIDRAKCNKGSYPMWNDIYNELGKVGIISVVATANRAWNVDTIGDVPSGCSSKYIIAVTNSSEMGKLYSRAGYGKKFIDLAAPGTNVFSTVPYNSIGGMSGTSMATPHVTGSIALLHSLAPVNLNDSYLSEPANFALYIKDVILDSVTPEPSLKGKTVTGGRLNLAAAAEKIL